MIYLNPLHCSLKSRFPVKSDNVGKIDSLKPCNPQIPKDRIRDATIYIYGSGSKPCTPVVHIKIAGIYGCSSP